MPSVNVAPIWRKTVTLIGGPYDGQKFGTTIYATTIHIPVPTDPTYVAELEEALSEYRRDPRAAYRVERDNTATFTGMIA
jgi:hypothetical protein